MNKRFPVRSPRPARVAATCVAAATVAVAVTGIGPAQAASTAGPAAGAIASGWRVIRVLGPADNALNSVAPISRAQAWAGGWELVGGFEEPVTYHLAGGKWHKLVPPGGRGVFVNSLSATSASNVWATESDAPTVLKLGRHGWVAHAIPAGRDQILIDGGVTTGPTGNWALYYDETTGKGYASRFDGKRWHRQLLPVPATADSDYGLVSASSASNIWALAFAGGKPAALHYNGKKWRITTFPAGLAAKSLTLSPEQILAVSPTSVWVSIATSSVKPGPLVLLHWNGKRWSKVAGKSRPAATLPGPMASDGRGGVWMAAVGGLSTSPGLLLLHYSGGRWSADKVPAYKGHLLGIGALHLIPGTRSVLGTAEILIKNSEADAGSAVLEYNP
jgi:hypothetical protein